AAFQTGVSLATDILYQQVQKKTASVNTWLQTHGDLDEGQDAILVCEDEPDVESVLSAVSGITYSGGGLPPENHLDALESLLNSAPWGGASGANRDAIVLMCNGPSKPSRSGTSPEEIGQRFVDLGILLCVVAEPIDPAIYALCQAANAEFEPISNAPDAELMRSIGSRLAASIMPPAASTGTVPMN
ncbi:MAG: hypothetical protein AAF491_00055, partial [Verrucomicrobiota bacterium]